MTKYSVIIQYPNKSLERIEVQGEGVSEAVQNALIFAKKVGGEAFFPLDDYISVCKKSREMGKAEERQMLQAWAAENAYSKLAKYLDPNYENWKK